MRITHLRLAEWRNFTAVEVDLAARLFILGPNAAGKSNLLDALRFLRDVAVEGGGLQRAVAARGGMGRIRCLAAREPAGGRVTLAVRVGDDDTPGRWEYELTIAPDPTARGRVAVVSEAAWANDRREVLVRRPDADDDADPQRLTRTAIEQVASNQAFREVAVLLASVRDLRVSPHLVRDAARATGRSGADRPGGDLLARIAATPAPERERRLGRVYDALRLAVPQLAGLEFVTAPDGRPHLQARYAHWRERSARQDETEFSDGTLRLIGLLWALQDAAGDGGPPVLIEEPELSLHADVVRQLPSLFARAVRGGPRQIIATTHATEILGDEGLGLDEVMVLTPGSAGTTALLAGELPGVADHVADGFTLGEALRGALRQEPVEGLPLSDLL